MNYKILKATKEDAPQILELLAQIANIHAKNRPDYFVSGRTKYSLEGTVRTIKKDIVFVAKTGDKVLGYAVCQLKDSPETFFIKAHKTLFLEDICIDEAFRNQGIGKSLLEEVICLATYLKVYNVELNVWEFNQSAIKFYEKMGMRTQSRRMEIMIEGGSRS